MYDNGVEKTYKTSEVSEEEINGVLSIIINSFNAGANGYLQLLNNDGLSTVIDLRKVSTIDFLNQD
ncbi:hypothetical protein P9858_13280 [Niallia circulans]|uniref:hypothetical protein n=1 Tax=Niallia circulans TaxID=1397 RepID=UPI002E22BC67|nr:hypothetical protein [Niallia circulans]